MGAREILRERRASAKPRRSRRSPLRLTPITRRDWRQAWRRCHYYDPPNLTFPFGSYICVVDIERARVK